MLVSCSCHACAHIAGAAVWLTVKDDASIKVGIEGIAEAAGCAVATLRAVAAKDS